MPRKATLIGPLMEVLPPPSQPWLYAFQIAAANPALQTDSLHDLLRRACDDLKIAQRKRDKETGRWRYARAGRR